MGNPWDDYWHTGMLPGGDLAGAKPDGSSPNANGWDKITGNNQAQGSPGDAWGGQQGAQNALNDINGVRDQIHSAAKDAWDAINGGYSAQRPTIDTTAGQTGSVAYGSTSLAAGPNGTQQNQTRDAQMALIQQLQNQAAGKGPSLAQMQLQKGTDQNISQAMAMGQSQRGAGQAGMLKSIQGQQAGIGQGMANDAGMLRLQEQMQAQNQLGQIAGQTRGQDQGWAGMGLQNNQFNAGQQNQGSQFNATQTNTMANSNADRAAQAREAQAKIDLELEKMRQQNAKDTSPMGAIGGLLGGMSMSDERVKTAIEPGEDELYSFLDSLGAHDYEYKDKKHGKGRRISPMAQEIEATPLGEEFVFETEDGKAVDYGKGLGTMLASTAALHKRLKKLEGE